MGFLFQHAALYDSLNVEQNVAFPLRRHAHLSDADREKKVHDLLATVGLAEGDAKKMPSEISGGMQKRVGLARALALDPSILLLDEPTAGLDPITAAEIGELIVELKKKRGITGVVVTHDVRGAKTFADSLLLSAPQDRLVPQGTFDELAKNTNEFTKRFLADQTCRGDERS